MLKLIYKGASPSAGPRAEFAVSPREAVKSHQAALGVCGGIAVSLLKLKGIEPAIRGLGPIENACAKQISRQTDPLLFDRSFEVAGATRPSMGYSIFLW